MMAVIPSAPDCPVVRRAARNAPPLPGRSDPAGTWRRDGRLTVCVLACIPTFPDASRHPAIKRPKARRGLTVARGGLRLQTIGIKF